MPLMYSSLYVGLVISSVETKNQKLVSVMCDNYRPETAISTQQIMILQHPKNYILEVLLTPRTILSQQDTLKCK